MRAWDVVFGSAVDTWATVGVAVGTLGAVAYALFRDLVVTPRQRPKLELRFATTGHDQVILETADGAESASVRLRVANLPGKETADDVVVMVTEVRETDGVTRPIGVPVPWSGTNPPLTVASVHPGSERHVDLLHVDRGAPEGGPVQLDLTPKPAGGRDLLDPGSYEISVEIRARNADAICYELPLSWDGRSAEAEVWDHLRIDPPRRVR